MEVTNTAAGISCLSVPADSTDIRLWLLNPYPPAEYVSSASSFRLGDRSCRDLEGNSTCVFLYSSDYPPVSGEDHVSDHILIPFPVSSTLVSGSIKITDITTIQSWATMQRNSIIFLLLKRLKGVEEGCLSESCGITASRWNSLPFIGSLENKSNQRMLYAANLP